MMRLAAVGCNRSLGRFEVVDQCIGAASFDAPDVEGVFV